MAIDFGTVRLILYGVAILAIGGAILFHYVDLREADISQS